MYKLTENPDVIIRLENGATIPKGHRFWREYEAWLADGGIPDPIKSNSELLSEYKVNTSDICRAKIFVAVQAVNSRVDESNFITEEIAMSARATELLDKKIDSTLTGAEQTELNNLKALNATIKALKIAKDDIYTELDGDLGYDYETTLLWNVQ